MQFIPSPQDPIWQFIGVVFSTILAIMAIIITIVVYQKQRSIKQIFCEITSNTSLASFNVEGKLKVQVIFGKVHLKDVNLIVLKVWNAGNKEILSSDYEEPIKITFGKNVTIIDVKVLCSSPNTLKEEVIQLRDNKGIILKPRLLNPKDNMELKFILTNFDGIINAEGRIAGVQNIKLRDRKEEHIRLTSRILFYSLMTTFIVLGLINALIPVGRASFIIAPLDSLVVVTVPFLSRFIRFDKIL